MNSAIVLTRTAQIITYMPGAAFQLKLGNYEIFNPFKGYPTLKSLVTIKFGNNETTGWVTVKVKI